MNVSAIVHRSAFTDCYALDEDNLEINLRTGKDITGVNIIWGDSYAQNLEEDGEWKGFSMSMKMKYELQSCFIWSAVIQPVYKRAKYYFEVFSGSERMYICENACYAAEEFLLSGKRTAHYFKMPWMNSADIIKVPEWVKDTVWYQIMPDRFCSAGNHPKRYRNKNWADDEQMTYYDFYGGDIKGITSRLGYLSWLGINGIYLTPVFESDSNHKYNINNYSRIDPDFGTEEEMVELVDKAHSLGIKIMVDAVFNHSGVDFAPWKDLVENGEKSAYKPWFFANKFPLKTDALNTADGRYFSFAFQNYMPKLNTNNDEVAGYFVEICRRWVKDWKIDGIRFDVADEISHKFVKRLNRELKSENPELFLLGEIWQDSVQWLMGDEYDSVMNYPLLFAVNNFFENENVSAKAFCLEINKVYSGYCRPVCRSLFNFVDTHDTGRAFSCSRSADEFYQKLALMFLMPGTSCIYYGTEIALTGADGPYKRRCMPWDKIDRGDFSGITKIVRNLIAVRRTVPLCSSTGVEFFFDGGNSRVIHFEKYDDSPQSFSSSESSSGSCCGSGKLEVFVNASASAFYAPAEGEVVFSYKYNCDFIDEGGILIIWKKELP